ncbi:hypothetical protein PAP_00755 [Palaeococcus pacificus DY20341]|uniref:Uncharacterized protein n=1 Tax=Palaeococcus pacificus DY20341 TaxID=1343739 RepID=A0A075LQN3_9EURY|nr:hypothetical protein PAP_00755 [Palaeococcus pacificus DY20341]
MWFNKKLKYQEILLGFMFSELKPTLIIKTKAREFEIDIFEEDEFEERPKVRFVQEIKRVHLA